MSRMIRALVALASTAAVLAGLTSAASAAITMSVGDPSLTAKVLVTVPVTVSCSPFDPALTQFSSGASVSIEQAAGKEIARGTGSASSLAVFPLLFTCEGADHTFDVDVPADPAGPPFKHGAAVLRGSASAGAGQSCGPTCFFNLASQSTNLAPTEVRIH